MDERIITDKCTCPDNHFRHHKLSHTEKQHLHLFYEAPVCPTLSIAKTPTLSTLPNQIPVGLQARRLLIPNRPSTAAIEHVISTLDTLGSERWTLLYRCHLTTFTAPSNNWITCCDKYTILKKHHDLFQSRRRISQNLPIKPLTFIDYSATVSRIHPRCPPLFSALSHETFFSSF